MNIENDKENYILNDKDKIVINSAIGMLQKIISAPFVKPSQLVSIYKVLHVLTKLPETTEDVDVVIDLCGPKRRFGKHEIFHYWKIEIEPNYISISSGGSFYRPSTGGDSFTCLHWTAQPECEADYNDYLDSLSIVDDAQPFDVEVEQMDLSQPGYSLDIFDDDNPLLDDDTTNEEEDEETEIIEDVSSRNQIEAQFDSTIDLAKAMQRGKKHAKPPLKCDICEIELEDSKYFIDGKVKNSFGWANMCSDCFARKGEAIGYGSGQLYYHMENGEWLLVEGFYPESDEETYEGDEYE